MVIRKRDYKNILENKEKILDEFEDYIIRCVKSKSCLSDEEDCCVLACVLILVSGGNRSVSIEN